MARTFKRVFAGGDLHCGHRVGLTHPDFQSQIPGKDYHRFQIESWEWFSHKVKSLKCDSAIINGDAVDGKGKRSGSVELITADWNKQREMAQAAIEEIGASKIAMTYGTPYHVGNTADHELELCNNLNALPGRSAKIRGQDWVTVNGTTFDIKHFISGSSISHGRHTAIAKSRLWNQLWAVTGQQPRADVLLRSHVHYKGMTGVPNEWLGLILPALQGLGSKFGARICEGLVNYGFATFDCYPGGKYTWQMHDLPVRYQKRVAREL